MNNILSAILNRKSVRDWSTEKVANDDIIEILEAGRHAPSPLNSQPWHFVVIQDRQTIKALEQCALHGSYMSKAMLLIVVTVTTHPEIDSWLLKHEQHLFSGACAIQNMWLAAYHLNLGSCWVTLDNKSTKQVLSIPNNQTIIGSLALGHMKLAQSEEATRKPLSEIVFKEKWGQHFKDFKSP